MYLHFYVYAYLRKDNTPYYIGKGYNKRAFQNHKNTPVPQDKSKIIFLETNLSEIGALAIERRMIRWYGRKDLGTGILRNRTDGGDGFAGGQIREETRAKMREAAKNRLPVSCETRAKLSQAGKGRIKSDQERIAISKSRKGHVMKEEHKQLRSVASKNRILTPEMRQRMATAKGRVVSQETRDKIGAAHKGKIVSPETREKLSKINKERPSNKGKHMSAESKNKMRSTRKANLERENGKV
jgi:hypothetical protein